MVMVVAGAVYFLLAFGCSDEHVERVLFFVVVYSKGVSGWHFKLIVNRGPFLSSMFFLVNILHFFLSLFLVFRNFLLDVFLLSLVFVHRHEFFGEVLKILIKGDGMVIVVAVLRYYSGIGNTPCYQLIGRRIVIYSKNCAVGHFYSMVRHTVKLLLDSLVANLMSYFTVILRKSLLQNLIKNLLLSNLLEHEEGAGDEIRVLHCNMLLIFCDDLCIFSNCTFKGSKIPRGS